MQRTISVIILGLSVLSMRASPPPAQERAPHGWTSAAPRDEIKPRFSFDPSGGAHENGSLIISADQREGQHGWWQKEFPITGGTHYRFSAACKIESVDVPRRSAIVRLLWQDDTGNYVRVDPPNGVNGNLPLAEPEYLVVRDGSPGWIDVSGVYRAPSKATKARVELHLRWAPGGRIEWSDAALSATEPPSPRKVRLAAVHFKPKGGRTPMENCRMFEPYITDAARQKADLVVLGEAITYVGLGKTFLEVAEPMPGPSTEYFGALAKKHKIHIVAGLVERDGGLIYNVAVLMGPDGHIIGKYRKVCLPRSEVEAGLAPGNDYPVFETELGMVGMMVCYDGFFPEVARELSNRGAEIICWPVWGCNPLLSAARASENHVYLVSSTYTNASSDWTITAVYNHDGKAITRAERWGTTVVAEVDLSQRFFWRNNLGDFRAELPLSRPVAMPEWSQLEALKH